MSHAHAALPLLALTDPCLWRRLAEPEEEPRRPTPLAAAPASDAEALAKRQKMKAQYRPHKLPRPSPSSRPC